MESFTEATTRLLAAQLIAAPQFPGRWWLPRLRSPAFTNLGHQPLVDYQQLATIVWRVALDASAIVKRVRNHRLLAAIGVPAAVLGLLLLMILPSSAKMIGVLELLIVGIVLKILKSKQDRTAHEAVAYVRANALTRLSQNDWPKQEPPITVMTEVGNGALGLDHVPVLVIFNPKRPFPGFGRLQVEQQFLCRPKTDAHQSEITELISRVDARIAEKIREHSRAPFWAGEVVVVDGNTLSMQSPWLARDKTPRLWLPRAELADIDHVDPRAAVRVFHASQILISDHATLATFFVRIFPAGSSVAFRIAITTLGPPMTGPAGVSARVLRHNVEVQHRIQHEPKPTRLTSQAVGELEDVLNLTIVERAHQADAAFQAPLDLSEITELNPDKESMRAPDGPYEHTFGRIAREVAMWPGCLMTRDQLRELGSYDLTPSFFGRPEALALVQAVYDQAVRAALEMFDDAGFDISDYRDRDGRFTIHADQIGQVVVGDHVTMSNGEGSNAEQGKPSRQAPSSNGSAP